MFSSGRLKKGDRVLTLDGEQLGRVKRVDATCFEVKADGRKDFWLARDAVKNRSGGAVTLSVGSSALDAVELDLEKHCGPHSHQSTKHGGGKGRFLLVGAAALAFVNRERLAAEAKKRLGQGQGGVSSEQIPDYYRGPMATATEPAPAASARATSSPASVAEPVPVAAGATIAANEQTSSALSSADLIGRDVVDVHGSHIGTVNAVYQRDLRDKPEWILVSSGLVEKSHVLLPLEGAEIEDSVRIAYPEDQVKATPDVDIEGVEELEEADEMQLYTHYSMRRELPDTPSAQTIKLRRVAVSEETTSP